MAVSKDAALYCDVLQCNANGRALSPEITFELLSLLASHSDARVMENTNQNWHSRRLLF